jgi:hypothetical protein
MGGRGVFVGVLVGVFVGVLVEVLVGIMVGVKVGILVGVPVGVGDGSMGTGVAASVIPSEPPIPGCVAGSAGRLQAWLDRSITLRSIRRGNRFVGCILASNNQDQ